MGTRTLSLFLLLALMISCTGPMEGNDSFFQPANEQSLFDVTFFYPADWSTDQRVVPGSRLKEDWLFSPPELMSYMVFRSYYPLALSYSPSQFIEDEINNISGMYKFPDYVIESLGTDTHEICGEEVVVYDAVFYNDPYKELYYDTRMMTMMFLDYPYVYEFKLFLYMDEQEYHDQLIQEFWNAIDSADCLIIEE